MPIISENNLAIAKRKHKTQKLKIKQTRSKDTRKLIGKSLQKWKTKWRAKERIIVDEKNSKWAKQSIK